MDNPTTNESTSVPAIEASRDVSTKANNAITWRKVAFWSGIIALPASVAVLGSRRSKLVGGVAGGLTALALAGLRWQFQRWFAAEPSYDVEKRIGKLEIRRYAAHVEAFTRLLTSDHDEALDSGFRRLATYIFGGNQRKETLEMSAPVTTQEHGEKLAMTAPVINQRTGSSHVMSFVMPPGRDLGSLPEPNDELVVLDDVPARRIAVLSYRGRYDAASVKQHQDELMNEVRNAGLHPVGTPLFAGFDPPNTIPWLRRNEVWIEVA